MAVCGFPFISQNETPTLTVAANTFHLANLFCCFSRYQPMASLHLSAQHVNHTQSTIPRIAPKGERLKRQFSNLFMVANSLLSTQLIRPYLFMLQYSTTTQHHSFFINLPLTIHLCSLSLEPNNCLCIIFRGEYQEQITH